MNDLARLDLVHRGQLTMARLEGEVDASNVDDIARLLTDDVANTASGLLLDLTAVSYLDSAGLRLLFDLHRRLRARQQEFRLVVAPDSAVMRVLTITEVPRVIRVSESVDEVLAELEADS